MNGPKIKQLAIFTLVHLKNINIPFTRAVKDVMTKLFSDLVTGFLLVKFKDIKITLTVIFRMLAKLGKIYKNREISKKNGKFLSGE